MTLESDTLDLSMFLKEYLEDARDGFQAATQALLRLEKNPRDLEPLNVIFRAVHTLKSSSAMIGFERIAAIAHMLEDLMDRLRGGEVPVTQATVDLLFDGIGTLERLVTARAHRGDDAEQDAEAARRLEDLKQRVRQVENQELLVRQAVVVIDDRGIVQSFNASAERSFGYAAAEVVGQNVKLLMPEPYSSEHGRYLSNYLLTGQAKIIGIGREVTGRRKDGSVFPLELAVNELSFEGHRLFIGTIRELGERKATATAVTAVEKTDTVRVPIKVLDSLFNVVGELIITRNRIATLLGDTATKDVKTALASLDRLVNEAQDVVTVARLVPVDDIFQKFPRLVRDLARERGRDVELVVEGRQIELDKSVLDAIGEPLVHLVRNAVDHGIEAPDDRLRAGKPRRGTVTLAARRAENHILVAVEDDGRGIDAARIRQIARQRELLDAAEIEGLSDQDAMMLLFWPGFTSVEQVTGISGRGVGLDVVRTVTERLGGIVEVTSRLGSGTRFTLRLPLATAILQTLMVGVGDHVFAVPSDLVVETLDVRPEDIKGVGKSRMLVLRGQVLPFVALHDALAIAHDRANREVIAIVIQRGERMLALGVDSVLDQVENIIKPFDPIAQRLRGFSGGTILGDGRVALLLDVAALFDLASVSGAAEGLRRLPHGGEPRPPLSPRLRGERSRG